MRPTIGRRLQEPVMRDLNRLWRPALCAVAVVAPLVGCSGTDATLNPSTDAGADTSDVLDLNDPNGGFDTNREAPGFGDSFLTGGEAEMDLEDAVADDPAVRDMLDDPDRYDVYGVRITWGYLERSDENVTAPVDWSGAAKIADGVLLGVRAISFERRQGDHVIGPRGEPHRDRVGEHDDDRIRRHPAHGHRPQLE